MAELVDARDLKSLDQKSCGFDSRSAHHELMIWGNMAATKKINAKSRVHSTKHVQPHAFNTATRTVRGSFTRLAERRRRFLARRPHRSFRRTYRRDYVRGLHLPGYIAFSWYVTKKLTSHWRTFVLLLLLYMVITIAVGGITNQDTYAQITTLLQQSSKDILGSGFSQIGQAGLLAVSAFLTGSGGLSADQQIYLAITLLFAWLTTVWLLREFLLGRKPRLRDGIYNAGAPVLSTALLILFLVIQFIPVGIVALIYAGLASVGILDGGFGNMLFWTFAIVVVTLVMYWATSTLLALVIVTLPGMYPFRALRAAGDVVRGRRLRLLYRLLWGIVLVALSITLVMIPIILFDTGLKSMLPGLVNVPIVSYAAALLSSGAVIWYAAYVYLLYRKVVDNDAKTA